MKFSYSPTPKVTLEVDGDTHLDVFKQMSDMQEVFGETRCGKCGGDQLRFVVRRVADGKKQYEYPELRCDGTINEGKKRCRAKLTFGQSEGGSLFPVRFQREGGEYKKDDEGKMVPKGTNGWVRYNYETKEEE